MRPVSIPRVMTYSLAHTPASGAASVSLSVLEALPSFLSPFVHTCALTLLLPGGLLAGSWPLFRCPHVTSASYEPSDAPGGPSLLRYTLTLPAGSTATVRIAAHARPCVCVCLSVFVIVS